MEATRVKAELRQGSATRETQSR